MLENKTKVWNDETTEQLVKALISIDSVSGMQNFLRDVMTEKEIIEISARLEAACMLRAGCTYTDIVAKTKLSSRTIARISDWMQNGCGGYATTLDLIGSHHDHISPVRAA